MLATVEDWNELNNQIRRDMKNAEYFLLNYDVEMQSYENAKSESKFLPCAHDEISGARRGTMAGHPTEANAIKNINFDEHYPAYTWLKAVEIVQRGLGERKRIFLNVRRRANARHKGRGKQAWVAYVQQHYISALQERYFSEMEYIGERTIHAWWSDMIRRVVEIHCRLETAR